MLDGARAYNTTLGGTTLKATISLKIRMIDSLSWFMLIEYPTSEYVWIAYVILLSTRNPISLSKILANKVIKGG